ncbi:hypothetical protein BBP40_010978 [Aspergillus hancockii]|nr:hypothetical protein BBP40_010978 [Aspergillus hancockii]
MGTGLVDDSDFSKDAAYCLESIRMELASSMLGAFSGNSCSGEKEYRTYLEYILGMETDSFAAVGHARWGLAGSIATVWTFSETQSAAITMTNGRDFRDASEFSAQISIQALFELIPQVDLLSETGGLDDPNRDPVLYVGECRGFDNRLSFSIGVAQEPVRSDVNLLTVFNHREATKRRLHFFKRHTYSYFVTNARFLMSDSMFGKAYRQTLLELHVDETGTVTGLWWLWDVHEEPAFLARIK